MRPLRPARNHSTADQSQRQHHDAGLGECDDPRGRGGAQAWRKEARRRQIMLLNGRALATDTAGNIPALEAVKMDAAQPIAVAPYSIVFARISHFNAPACS
jgi:hypothetical protein